MHDTNRSDEEQVLREATAALEDWARRLPHDSPWREKFAGMAEVTEAGAQLSQMRQARHAA